MIKTRVIEVFPFQQLEKAYQYVQKGGKDFPAHHFWLYDAFKNNGHPTTCASYDDNSFWRKLGEALRIGNLEQQINCLKKSKEFDVIFDPEMKYTFLIALLKVLKLYRKPLISLAQRASEIENKNQLKRWKEYLVRYIYYKGTDLVIFYNKQVFQKSNQYPIKANARMVNSWGVDVDFFQSFFQEQTSPPTQNYFFATGGSLRDYETLVKAFNEINFNLKITTQGSFSEELQRLLTPNITIDNSIIPGMTSTGRIRKDYYNSLAVAVPMLDYSPYSFAPFGITVVLEAFAMCKPVIMTPQKPYPFDVEKEKIGFNVDIGDVQGWRQALSFLIDNPGEAKEMGERALHFCRKKFNYELFSKEVMSYVDEYLSGEKVTESVKVA